MTDIDGVLRGKYLHKESLCLPPKADSGFCNVVFGWDMTDSVYDNAHVIGWQHGFPDAMVHLDQPPDATCLGTTMSRFSLAISLMPMERRFRSARGNC